MFRSIYWYFNFIFSLLGMYPKIPKYRELSKKLTPLEFDDEIWEATSAWANKQLKAAGVKVEMEGYENIPRDTNCLFVSNHQGNFDTAVHMVYIDKPKGFVSKVSIKKFKIVSIWMGFMNSIFLDRQDAKNAARAISDGVKLLKEGHSLIIFPEGTRSKSSKIGVFKEGAFVLATKSNVPIVPVTIDGAYKISEANKNFVKSGTIKLCVHPRIETKGLSKEEKKELPAIVHKIIKEKLETFSQ